MGTRLSACFNDCAFVELQEILQQAYESVVYSQVSRAALDLAPHLKSMPDAPAWNASRENIDRYLQNVTNLWAAASTTVYGIVKQDFSLSFGESLITKKNSVTILPDRVRLAIYCLNSVQNGPGGKIKWWDAQSLVSGSLNIRGTDGEYGAQAYIMDDNGDRTEYGDRVLTSGCQSLCPGETGEASLAGDAYSVPTWSRWIPGLGSRQWI
jgi:hypothetical protein